VNEKILSSRREWDGVGFGAEMSEERVKKISPGRVDGEVSRLFNNKEDIVFKEDAVIKVHLGLWFSF
jgi:hypothetical protein